MEGNSDEFTSKSGKVAELEARGRRSRHGCVQRFLATRTTFQPRPSPPGRAFCLRCPRLKALPEQWSFYCPATNTVRFFRPLAGCQGARATVMTWLSGGTFFAPPTKQARRNPARFFCAIIRVQNPFQGCKRTCGVP